MPYKIILFDLDGTLIDPKVGITTAVQHALKKHNIDEHPDNLVHFIGPPLHKSFQKHYNFDEKKSREAVQHFREHFIPKGLYESTVYEGIPELLQKLKTAGKKLYIVTSKPTDQAKKVTTYHNLDTFFEKIVGSKPDLSDADKSTLIEEALLINSNEQKSLFVMIGDREHDIIGAKANGIDSIGVTYGYGSIDELTAINPTYLAKSIDDLEKYLL